MVALPLIAALVSILFCVLLLVRFSRRHQFPHLAWGVAMGMYAIASLVVAAGVGGGWDKTLFKIYWLFGALLNVPYLALGSIALLRNRVLTAAAVLAVALGTLFAFGVVIHAKANPAGFIGEVHEVPLGRAVWGSRTLVAKLGTYYSIPAYVVVVLIAALSSRARKGRRPPVNRVRGNWLIAGGATIVAVAGAVARYGRGAFFSMPLAIGVSVMFAGFILASRPATAAGARPESAIAEE